MQRTNHFGLTLLAALYVMAVAFGVRAEAQILFAADFNAQPNGDLATGSPPALPQTIIVDAGASVRVVASAGNLSDRPIVLHSIVDSLAAAAFFNPIPLSFGRWRVSWDSAILGPPVNNPANQFNVGIIDGTATAWGIKYAEGAQFLIEDGSGFHSTGSFAVGQSDHFDLLLNLDSRTYTLFVNGANLSNGGLGAGGGFGHTDVMTNGRVGLQLPDLAFDNFVVQQIPEPGTALLAATALVVLLRRQRIGVIG